MPRPKRTKVAPSKPISFATIVAGKRNQDLQQSPASGSVSSSRGTNGSDDSEGIVTKSTNGVNRKGVAPQVATMSGALAVEDIGEKRLKPLSSRRRVALSRIAREADHAKAIQTLKAQKEAALAEVETANEGKQVEIQVQSTQPLNGPVATMVAIDPSLHAPATATKVLGGFAMPKPRTTPSRETSILAIENFNRRPRQPSLLQIAQAQIPAEESSLNDTLDDFDPDDESTPLHLSYDGLPHEQLSTSSSHQNSSRKRKLSAPEIQVPASQPQELPDRSPSPELPSSDNIFGITEDDSQSEHPLPAIPTSNSTSGQQANP
ncbi:MAG: hypothetical protein Q9170_003568, partial [Blastenia crenularia]